MKKSIFLFFAAILCATSASAWSYKSAANGWKASTSGFTWVTMNSGKSVDVVMLKDVGDGVNICQNDDGTGHTLYCKWTKTSGDIFRGTARWNNGLYSDETVVIPGGKVYIKVGSGAKVLMTAGDNYTYTADVTFSNTGESYTISGETVSGATIESQNYMPSAGKPASLTMSNSYTSKKSGNVHIVFDLKTNRVIETNPLETEVYLAGDMTNWGDGKIEFKKATAEATTASITVALEAKTYEFKLIIGEEWKGNNGTMQRSAENVQEGGWSFEGGDNCKIVADIAGDYTFTWDLNTQKLTVTYPELPTPVYKDITVTIGTAGFTTGQVPTIKWWGANGLADATEPQEMTATGFGGRYSYTFEQVDSIVGVNFYIELGGLRSKTIKLHETPASYSQFNTILQDVVVKGNFDGWNDGVQLTTKSNKDHYQTISGVVQLDAEKTYEFKLVIDNAWKGVTEGITITKDAPTTTLGTGEVNAQITTDLKGGYTFTYNYLTKELTVTYPYTGALDLGELTPYYGDEGVSLSDDNYNSVEIYNFQDEEYKYGNDFDVKASIKHNGNWLDLSGKASWTLADGVMTLNATNMVDENNTVCYTITATALAPVEKTITCNGQYEIVDYGYCIDSTFVGVTEDEEKISIAISTYSSEENEVLGSIGKTYFEKIISYSVTSGEDGVLILAVVAKDGAGNTYNITITATKLVYPSVNIYGATAKLDEEGTLTLSGTYEGKTVISQIWGYEGAGDYEYVGLVAPEDESFGWSADIATVTEEGDQYTITGVFMDYNTEEKYEVMITTAKNPTTALDNVTSTVAPVKAIVNGQLVIVKDGVQYNAQGAVVK